MVIGWWVGGLIGASSLILHSISLVREIGLLELVRKGTLVIKFKEMDCTEIFNLSNAKQFNKSYLLDSDGWLRS